MLKLSVVALAACAGCAFAQTPCPTPTNCFTNGSFEEPNPFDSREPRGWHNLSNPVESIRRTVDDGLTPTLYPIGEPTNPPGALTPQDGSWTISLLGATNATNFRGFTTDTRNFFAPGFPFFDPVFDWDGGDVVFSGYYMIPADMPVVGDVCFIKMNIKLGNQDYATMDSIVERPDLNISGHTDGQWRYFEQRWSIADIQAEVQANVAEGFFTIPPYPNHLKVTIARWDPIAGGSTGVIFWDNCTVVQETIPTCSWSTTGCFADFTGDGGIDGDDVIAFFSAWDQSGECADVTGDGGVDGDDVIAFFASWDVSGTGFPGC